MIKKVVFSKKVVKRRQAAVKTSQKRLKERVNNNLSLYAASF
jgi:hypothetical protein